MSQTIVGQLQDQHKDLLSAQIEGILYLIQYEPNLTLPKLILLTGLPKVVLVNVIKSLDKWLDNSTPGVLKFLTSISEDVKELNLHPYRWSLLADATQGLEQRHAQLRQQYFFSQKREYDQFFATAPTSIRKAMAIQAKTGIKGTKIALLGDDDLLSVAIPLLNPNYSEIVVFDIDELQLEKIKELATKEGFKNISTQHYDARMPLPKKYLNYFDVAFTDPPYTKTGFDLFLDRCIELVKIPKTYAGSYIYICYGIGLKNQEREVKLLESIYIRNVYLEDKLFKFNKYEGAETVGNASSLFVLKTTPFTSTVQLPPAENIYTFENVKEEKFPYVDHYVFKLYDVEKSILKSKSRLGTVTGEFCLKHKLKVMDTHITQFKPFGYSITYILSNSNLVVHTWEEYSAVHVDLITCSPIFNAPYLSTSLKRLFNARNIEYYKVA
jgi:S-adenosylmethionine/arginine decarboxylase-like enzyme